MSIRLAPLFVAFAVLAGTAAGCAQSRGETCQINEDCESGLTCCKTSSTVSARGTCDNPCPVVAADAGPREDAGAAVDAGETDAGESDAGTDAGESDAGTDAGESDADTDAGESDAGTDAGGSDAGTDAGESDAGHDAGTGA